MNTTLASDLCSNHSMRATTSASMPLAAPRGAIQAPGARRNMRRLTGSQSAFLSGAKLHTDATTTANCTSRKVVVTYAEGDTPLALKKEDVKPFEVPMEPTGQEATLQSLPAVARFAAAGVMVAGAAFIGATAGGSIPVPPKAQTMAKAAGAVAVGGAAAYGAVTLDKTRKKGAVKALNNRLIGRDPSTLDPAEIVAINSEYGVDLGKDYTQDLQNAYNHYLSSVLPPGDQPLGGWEPAALTEFKNALGLSDADAAAAHIEVGRQIFRLRFESGSKDGELEERRAFQKLVFVSNQVFGDEKSKFLTPWKRLFNVTDAQINVACRDNAAGLYQRYLEAFPEPAAADLGALQQAAQYQQSIGLKDELAATTLQKLANQKVAVKVEEASAVLKNSGRTRSKDVTGAMDALKYVLKYNQDMVALSGEAGVAPGTGPVNLFESEFHTKNKTNELSDLYQMYFSECIKDGEYSDQTEAEMSALKNIFGLGTKEAEGIVIDTSSKVYRMLLLRASRNGSLDVEKPSAVLNSLISQLRFPKNLAAKVHEEAYKQKLEALLEKKKLTDEDADALAKLRIKLCIPKDTVAAAHKERCGALFRSVVEESLSGGIEGYDRARKDRVVAGAKNLRLSADIALDLLGQTVKKVFTAYIKDAQNKATRLDQAKELKKMIMFSNIVVGPLITAIKPPTEEEIKQEKAQEEMAKMMKEAMEMSKKEEEDEAKAAEGGEEAEAKAEDETKAETKDETKAEDATDAIVDVEVEPKDTPAAKEAAAEKKEEAPQGEKKKRIKLDDDSVMWDGQSIKLKSQKRITMKDDMPLKERQELYRGFLLYCLSGETVDLPMGAKVTMERDQSEFKYLEMLGDVLGLTPPETSEVQKGMAEQAFRGQVQNIMGDGKITKDKQEQLNAAQKQLGLDDASAKVIIRGVQNEKMSNNVKAQVSGGKLSMKEIRALKDQDVDVETMLSMSVRSNMFRKEVEDRLSDGTGDFNREAFLNEVPELLAITQTRAEAVVKEVAAERRRDSLVTAIAMLRQKDQKASIKSIKNLISAINANPSDPLKWPVQEELQDLYSLYCLEKGSDKATVASVLGIEPDKAAQLEEVVASGGWQLVDEMEEEGVF